MILWILELIGWFMTAAYQILASMISCFRNISLLRRFWLCFNRSFICLRFKYRRIPMENETLLTIFIEHCVIYQKNSRNKFHISWHVIFYNFCRFFKCTHHLGKIEHHSGLINPYVISFDWLNRDSLVTVDFSKILSNTWIFRDSFRAYLITDIFRYPNPASFN